MTESTERTLRNIALLALRLGIGGMFVFWHGWGKIFPPHRTTISADATSFEALCQVVRAWADAAVEKWIGLGGAMRNLGVSFAPAFWGFMSAFAEFAGGACLMLGLFFRPMCAVLAFNMLVAALMHYNNAAMRPMISYPIEIGIVVLSLLIIGPGDWALGKLLWRRKKTPRA